MRPALACVFLAAAASSSAAVKVTAAAPRAEVQVGGKVSTFYKLAPGKSLAIAAGGPALLDVQIRAAANLLGDARVSVTLVRDMQSSSSNAFELPPDPTASAGGVMLTVERTIQAQVPAGDHKFVITAESGVELFVRVSEGFAEMPDWAASPELPLEALAVAAVKPAPAPPPPPVEKRIEATAVVAAAPVAPPDAASEPAPPAAPSTLGLMVALKAALLVPSGKPTGVTATAADLIPKAGRTATFSGSLEVRYALPPLQRSFALDLEAGLYPLSGHGERTFANDPDFPSFQYDYAMLAIPLTFGAAWRLPLALPVTFWTRAGFAAVHVSSETTWSAGPTVIIGAPQVGWAYGFYLGAEGSIPLGPGAVLVELRYMNARTDLGFTEIYTSQPFNKELGDVQGTNLLAGYRFSF